MKKIILILFTCLCATLAGKAQVTIGTLQDPHRGALIHLRTTTDNVPTQRVDTLGTKLPVVALPDTAHLNLGDALIYNLDVDETATGMVVYNTTNDPCGRGLIPCLYVWDGATWRPAGCSFPECAPSGSPVWEKNPYVGAFWRDNQTGERIIVGTASPTTPWKVDVDDPSGSGNWLTLAVGRQNNATLYTPMPDNAESYPVTPGVTHIEAVGDIVFRIGATGINPQTDASYDTGKRPRYATVTLTVLTNPVKVYTLYCRQGESADYVFSPTDLLTGGTGSGNARTYAKKFSPYNLTAAAMTDGDVNPNYVQVGARGGVFVDYPTKVGAFFQWACATNSTYAYHPTKPSMDVVASWDFYYASGTWNTFGGVYETCPQGWRRFMVGDTTSLHNSQPANGADSELMQSLYYSTFDADNDSTSNFNSDNYRYWGYYADGYFDRRTITSSIGHAPADSSAVSPDTKDAAYRGLLFTNPGTGASLFTPAGGIREAEHGYLSNSGSTGYYWSSSARNLNMIWELQVHPARAYQYERDRANAISVRCVKE